MEEKTGLEKVPKKIKNLAEDIEKILEFNRDIASDRSPNSIAVSYSDVKKIPEELRKIYDFLSQGYGYKTMDHMISVAHAVMIAAAIANPERFSQSALRAIEQVQASIRPAKAEGDSSRHERKEDIMKRIVEHMAEAGPKGKA